jgi:hypothetical protein
VRLSTAVVALGVLVFALPIPGTFVLGGLLVLAGLGGRLLG